MDAVTDWKQVGEAQAGIVAAVEAKAKRIDTPYDGGSIAWRSFGDGPPLVLLHGGFGGWGHWLRNVGPLSRKYRVLAPDMPGFGDFGDPPILLPPRRSPMRSRSASPNCATASRSPSRGSCSAA